MNGFKSQKNHYVKTFIRFDQYYSSEVGDWSYKE